MMINEDGRIRRKVEVTPFQDIQDCLKPEYDPIICKPLLTGIGAGTSSVSSPAPYIVKDKVKGVDVVTSVSECHYLYAGIKVKIDTEKYVGEEGAKVFCNHKEVGIVGKEQYGSKFLEIGNVNTLTNGRDGWKAAKLVADIANRKPVKLNVANGAAVELQIGQKPIIDGELCERRRYGCGSDVAESLKRVYLNELYERGIINEAIVIDRGSTGHFGVPQDPKIKYVMKSGIKCHYLNPCLLCLPHVGGKGWGGTPLKNAFDIIADFKPEAIETGYTILITEPSADHVALYEFTKEKKFKEIPLPTEAQKAIDRLRAECEPARVSAYFIAGSGGTARKGVTRRPESLSEAVLKHKARVTVGGAPAFIFTGGGINFMVDVEEVQPGAFYWTAAPAVVAPLEFTMKLEDFERIGGFVEYIRPLKEILKKSRRG
jgi:hypothetical protein